MSRFRHIALGLVLALAPLSISAAVLDSAPNGFTSQHVVEIAAAPADVYAAFLEVDSWWSKDHRYFGPGSKLSIEPKAGGCWCERGEGGAEARHMVVVFVQPGVQIDFRGTLGPLHTMGLEGAMTIELAPKEGGKTGLKLTYAIGGYLNGGLDQLAPIVDGVLGEQVGRFKLRVETGSPEPPQPPKV